MPSAAATPTMWRRPTEATPTTLSVHAERAPLAASRASLPATTPPWQESPETALDASRRGGGLSESWRGGERKADGRERVDERAGRSEGRTNEKEACCSQKLKRKKEGKDSLSTSTSKKERKKGDAAAAAPDDSLSAIPALCSSVRAV